MSGRLNGFIMLGAVLTLSIFSTCKPQGLTIKSITTNSELIEPQHGGKYIYPASYSFDDDINTSWSEANFDYGKNTYVKIEFSEKATIDEVQIINGFAINERLYRYNNRVKDLEIIGESATVPCTLKDNTREYQSIKLPQSMSSTFFKFNIKTVYEGSSSDTLITDIKLLYRGKAITITNFSQFQDEQKKVAMEKALEAGKSPEKYFRIVYANYNSTWYCPAFKSYYTFYHNGEYNFQLPGDDSNGTYKVEGNTIYFTPRMRDEYSGGSVPVLNVTFQPFGNHTLKINDFKCNRLN